MADTDIFKKHLRKINELLKQAVHDGESFIRYPEWEFNLCPKKCICALVEFCGCLLTCCCCGGIGNCNWLSYEIITLADYELTAIRRELESKGYKVYEGNYDWGYLCQTWCNFDKKGQLRIELGAPPAYNMIYV